jgi:hypothetical protein
VVSLGPNIEVDAYELVYTNPSESLGAEQCVRFWNTGQEALAFKKAYIPSASVFYKITKSPNEGATIDALGTGDNPKGNEKKLEICVRLTPNGKMQDYNSSVVIESSDKKQPKLQVSLKVVFTKQAVYTLSCDEPTGAIAYNFEGKVSGTSFATCSIHNEGPGGFVINSVTVQSIVEDAKIQEVIEKLYTVKVYKIGLDGKKTDFSDGTTKKAIGEGKTRYFELQFDFPNDGIVHNAEVVVSFSQANVADSVQIPVSVGSCKMPSMTVAPGTLERVWLMAKLDMPKSSKIIVANQSCAPLQIIKLCNTVQSIPGNGVDPCQNQAFTSPHFKVKSDDGLNTVMPWSLFLIDVELAPQDEKYPILNHLLNIRYCPGRYQAGKCLDDEDKAMQLQTHVVNLSGLVQQKEDQSPLQLPKLALSSLSNEAIVGQPYKIEAKSEEGSYPIASFGAYKWAISERPKGSKLWLSASHQASKDAWVTIKPDIPGKYVVLGTVQSYDPNNPAKEAWSEQVTWSFTAVNKTKGSSGGK